MTPDERAATLINDTPNTAAFIIGTRLLAFRAELADAIRAAIAEEREACAAVADSYVAEAFREAARQVNTPGERLAQMERLASDRIAAAIRARG